MWIVYVQIRCHNKIWNNRCLRLQSVSQTLNRRKTGRTKIPCLQLVWTCSPTIYIIYLGYLWVNLKMASSFLGFRAVFSKVVRRWSNYCVLVTQTRVLLRSIAILASVLCFIITTVNQLELFSLLCLALRFQILRWFVFLYPSLLN